VLKIWRGWLYWSRRSLRILNSNLWKRTRSTRARCLKTFIWSRLIPDSKILMENHFLKLSGKRPVCHSFSAMSIYQKPKNPLKQKEMVTKLHICYSFLMRTPDTWKRFTIRCWKSWMGTIMKKQKPREEVYLNQKPSPKRITPRSRQSPQ